MMNLITLLEKITDLPYIFIQGPDNPLAISIEMKEFLKNYNLR